MHLALFPLPEFLLPGGKTRLRIIEPRYLRLVSEATPNNLGFVLCLQTKTNAFFEIATRVSIYDFNRIQNNFLTIDIEAQERVLLSQFTTDKDGLLHADVRPYINRSEQQLQLQDINSAQFNLASQMLKIVLINHPLYQGNIEQLPFENWAWVCQRWLELLPIDSDQKYRLANHHSIADTLNFVCQIIAS